MALSPNVAGASEKSSIAALATIAWGFVFMQSPSGAGRIRRLIPSSTTSDNRGEFPSRSAELFWYWFWTSP
jgi:hypothetical protein